MDGNQARHVKVERSMKLALCIRGHLRSGLTDSRLNDYLNLLKRAGYNIDLFLHTWDQSEAQCSYRKLDYNNFFEVKKQYLKTYFSEQFIKYIKIQSDTNLKLYGNLEGNIPGTKCPILAWKRMWAGKFNLISHVYDNYRHDYDFVISTRYDKFTTQVCYTPVKNLLKLTHVETGLSLKYPKYYRLLKGVDNYYCGRIEDMYKITSDFHYSLDDIIKKYSVKGFQEEIFYKYAVDSGLVA